MDPAWPASTIPTLLLLTIVAHIIVFTWRSHVSASNFSCPSALYSFGDSLADTGNLEYVFPYEAPAEHKPYGEQPPFRKPSFRYCDGRLVIDFLAQAFSLPFLNPYMQVITPDYSHGCNFAISGSTATNITPFYLQTQVNQFLRFRSSVLQKEAQSLDETTVQLNSIPASESFEDSMYIISIGGNDFLFSYQYFAPHAFIEQVVIPRAVNAVAEAVTTLYKQNARSIMVWNIPAQGCSPIVLTLFGASANDGDYDALGCLKTYNAPIQTYNQQLKRAVQDLRGNLTGARIIYADYYAANLDILHNATQYGLDPNSTLKACCGAGGTYNYDSQITCGDPRVPACANPSQYVNWDGVHFTESFYRRIAKFFLNGQYLHPPTNISASCNLNFTAFD